MAHFGSTHKETTMPVEKLAADTAFSAAKLVEGTIKETWNKLDAASDKPKPSEYLGKKAMRAVQGITDQRD